ncbi:MAG TPA: type II secretion system protein [Deltaproteobacteria bacterium]|nr:type II secretion system protein [Deltaproteobacteria bacterium]
MMIKKSDTQGFTLIEVIVTLALVGITAALAGVWIVSVASGYVFTKMNTETAQKAQLAVTRLTKEFNAIKSLDAASNDSTIVYTRSDADSSEKEVTVTFNSGDDELLIGEQDAQHILADNLESFTVTYCSNLECETGVSPVAAKIIEFTITFKSAPERPFTRRVTPRNLQ